MTIDRFRQLCLRQPGATEQIQWQVDAVFKVGGRMFAVACTDVSVPNARVCAFKCDDETFAELCEREGIGPAPYMARMRWVALDTWDALPDREITALVEHAYRIVRGGLTKKAQAALPAIPVGVGDAARSTDARAKGRASTPSPYRAPRRRPVARPSRRRAT